MATPEMAKRLLVKRGTPVAEAGQSVARSGQESIAQGSPWVMLFGPFGQRLETSKSQVSEPYQ